MVRRLPALPISRSVCYNPIHGAVAHLVERSIRIAEVRSSSLLCSTIFWYQHKTTTKDPPHAGLLLDHVSKKEALR